MNHGAIETVYRVLSLALSKGFVTNNDLKKIFGSATRRDLWLERIFLRLNLLEGNVSKVGRREIKYYRLTMDGFEVLESMLNRAVFETYCMTMKTRRFRKCLPIKAEQISKLEDLTKTPFQHRL